MMYIRVLKKCYNNKDCLFTLPRVRGPRSDSFLFDLSTFSIPYTIAYVHVHVTHSTVQSNTLLVKIIYTTQKKLRVKGNPLISFVSMSSLV